MTTESSALSPALAASSLKGLKMKIKCSFPGLFEEDISDSSEAGLNRIANAVANPREPQWLAPPQSPWKKSSA